MCNCKNKTLKLFVSYQIQFPDVNVVKNGICLDTIRSHLSENRSEFIDITFNATDDPSSYEIQREIEKEITRIENIDEYHNVKFISITQFMV